MDRLAPTLSTTMARGCGGLACSPVPWPLSTLTPCRPPLPFRPCPCAKEEYFSSCSLGPLGQKPWATCLGQLLVKQSSLATGGLRGHSSRPKQQEHLYLPSAPSQSLRKMATDPTKNRDQTALTLVRAQDWGAAPRPASLVL
jgi:hypothetical protein